MGGVPEIIEDGRNGFLVEKENAVGLSEKLVCLAKDKSLREHMGSEGKKIVNDFSLDNMIVSYKKFFEEVTG